MRVVRIICVESSGRERVFAVNRARSLRAALEDYFKTHLRPMGYKDPVYAGNQMTVTSPTGHDFVWLAREAK